MTDISSIYRNSKNKKGEIVTQCKCFLCSKWFQFGQHIYDGKRISEYDIKICEICYKSNRDGFLDQDASKIEAHLRDNGLNIPARNEKGWLPCPYAL
jgi:hypothetical protein